jgi:hypothetical protein
MPQKARDVKAGTRDHCHLCSEVIVLKISEGGFRHLYWVHLGTDGLYCAGHEGEFKFRALSRTYCGVSMDRSWFSDTCFREIKDQERMMCGIHASHERRREQKTKQYEEKWELNDYIKSEIEKLEERLKEEFGLDIKAEFDWKNGAYTGNIVVDPVQLIAFLDGLADDGIEWEDA